MSNIDLENLPSMEDLLNEAEKARPQLKEGQIYSGKIVSKNENGIMVDVGGKAESFVDRTELKKFDEIQVGDAIDVYLENPEGENSTPKVSVHKAELQKAWNDIVNNHQEGSVIKGTVVSKVKGGLVVDCGVEAFLPGSQVDLGGGSRNLDDWFAVASSTDHYLRGFRGTPYKYFRIALVCDLERGESLSGASVEFDLRENDQLR